MTENHYTRVCEICNKEYPATISKNGKPRDTKLRICSTKCRSTRAKLIASGHLDKTSKEKVYKNCALCGKVFGPLTVRISKMRGCCSRSCANILRSEREGKRVINDFRVARHCNGCHAIITRKVGSVRDSGRYCSRECAYRALRLIAEERRFLKRLADRPNQEDEAKERQIAIEVSSLREISRAIRKRASHCSECGVSHIRRRPYNRQCSRVCEDAYNATKDDRDRESRRKYKRQWRRSPEGRATKSLEKALRRASEKMDGADKIDPIKVFEKDGWTCYICGDSTPKELRGTNDDKAPELEHVVALANGGTHTWDNVRCACRKCNGEKGAKEIEIPFIS